MKNINLLNESYCALRFPFSEKIGKFETFSVQESSQFEASVQWTNNLN